MGLVKWGYVAGKHPYSRDIIYHKEAVCQDLELQSEWGFLGEKRENGGKNGNYCYKGKFIKQFGSLWLQDLQTMLQNAVCDASVMIHVGLGAASKPWHCCTTSDWKDNSVNININTALP